MVQKVKTFFGIHLEVDTFIDEQEYVLIRDRLADRVKSMKEKHKRSVEVYIHKLDITFDKSHLGLKLGDRLDFLNVSLQIMKKAQQGRQIIFVNPDSSFQANPDVPVKRHSHRVAYKLSGEYCEENEGYHDYICTLVVEGCPAKYKKLTVSANAQPSQKLIKRIDNFPKVVTKLPFQLTKDVQLTFEI